MTNEQAIDPSLSRAARASLAELISYGVAVAAWVSLVMLERQTRLPLAAKLCLVCLGLGMPLVGILLDPVRRAVAQREFAGFFYSPVGYVAVAVFTSLTALFFVFNVFVPGQPIETAGLFEPMVLWVLAPVVPAISMRLFAEENRSGNIEALVTAPLTDAQLVVGKWAGGLGFFAAALVTSLPMVLLLEVYGSPDYGPIFTGYIGLLLVGGAFLAIGVFASVITANQIIAFLVALILIAAITFINLILVNNYLWGPWATALKFLNPYEHFRSFSKGILDTGNFAYLLSVTALFLACAAKALESRKWR